MKSPSQFGKYYLGKRVLVTGGAGFIGSFLVDSLNKLGAEIVLIIDPKTELWRINKLENKIKIDYFDVSNVSKLKSLVLDFTPQIIFHLAANLDTRQDWTLLRRLVKDNFYITLNLLELSSQIKLERFIQSGSMAEYGNGKTPLKEDQKEFAVSPYSLSKIMATQASLLFYKSIGLPVCVVRPAVVFGPRQSPGMLVPNLIKSCLDGQDFKMNPGCQKRDFVYVTDIVEGMLLAGFKKEAIGEIINLGGGRSYVVKEVAKKIVKLTGSSIKIEFGAEPYRPLDSMELCISIKKAKKLLNWKPKIGLDEGLKKTISWYQGFKI